MIHHVFLCNVYTSGKSSNPNKWVSDCTSNLSSFSTFPFEWLKIRMPDPELWVYCMKIKTFFSKPFKFLRTSFLHLLPLQTCQLGEFIITVVDFYTFKCLFFKEKMFVCTQLWVKRMLPVFIMLTRLYTHVSKNPKVWQ